MRNKGMEHKGGVLELLAEEKNCCDTFSVE